MAPTGKYSSLDKAIRESLWSEPDQWIAGDNNRFLCHADGLDLILPIATGRWTVGKPLGYIRLSWYTHFTINAMLHGHRLQRA